MLITNTSGARRTFNIGGYRLTLGPGQSVETDLPELLDHLRTVEGVKIADGPSTPTGDGPSSERQVKRSKPDRIIVAN